MVESRISGDSRIDTIPKVPERALSVTLSAIAFLAAIVGTALQKPQDFSDRESVGWTGQKVTTIGAAT